MLTKKAVLGALAVLALATGATALGTRTAVAQAAAGETVSVVATTGMIADAARVVGGDRVAVEALMGPGVDPHGYRQTRSDITRMARADLVLFHGLDLEAQLADLLADLGRRQPVVSVAENLPRDRLVAHDDYADKFDPHVWMDPDLWAEVVIAVRDALVAVDPEGTAAYGANAERYLEELDALARYAREVLSTVPEEQRVLLTSHDAFNYFGRAYGFEVVGIQGISTESEAGLSRVRTLVDLLVERDVRAVFVETSVSDRNVRALAEGAAAAGHDVRVGGELFSDAMGDEGTWEGTYVGMIDHNATTVARALGGEAPAGGMSGRLGED